MLLDQDPQLDFQGSSPEDFHQIFLHTGETYVAVEDVENWFDYNGTNPGYQVLSLGEIAESAVNESDSRSSSSESEEEVVVRPKMAQVCDSIDLLLKYVDVTTNREIQGYYHHLHILWELIICEQYQSGKQLKLDSFFKSVAHEGDPDSPPTPLYPTTDGAATPPLSPLPSTNRHCFGGVYWLPVITTVRPPI